MSTSLDRILETLDQFPSGICDDCLSVMAGVQPRQQTNQICRRMEGKEVVRRAQALCPICVKQKITNTPVSRRHNPPVKLRDEKIMSGTQSLRDMSGYLDQIRRKMIESLNLIDKQSVRSEGLSGRIARLRESGTIPSSVACMMLTLNSLRNLVVYDGFKPGPHEIAVVEAAWLTVQEWRTKSA